MSTQTTTLKVSDMHCPSCPRLIQMDLQDLPGIIAVNADLGTKLVVVEYDPASISPPEIISTIKDSGYTATIIN